jgi:methionine synthase II (cobalamin-independent)
MYRDLADAYNAEFKEAVAAGVEAFQLDDVDACEYACAETDCGPFTFPRPMAKGKLEAMSAAAEMLRSEYGG